MPVFYVETEVFGMLPNRMPKTLLTSSFFVALLALSPLSLQAQHSSDVVGMNMNALEAQDIVDFATLIEITTAQEIADLRELKVLEQSGRIEENHIRLFKYILPRKLAGIEVNKASLKDLDAAIGGLKSEVRTNNLGGAGFVVAGIVGGYKALSFLKKAGASLRQNAGFILAQGVMVTLLELVGVSILDDNRANQERLTALKHLSSAMKNYIEAQTVFAQALQETLKIRESMVPSAPSAPKASTPNDNLSPIERLIDHSKDVEI